MDYEAFIWGLVFLILGIAGFIILSRSKIKKTKEYDGSYFSIIVAGIGGIIGGLYLIIKEIMNIF